MAMPLAMVLLLTLHVLHVEHIWFVCIRFEICLQFCCSMFVYVVDRGNILFTVVAENPRQVELQVTCCSRCCVLLIDMS